MERQVQKELLLGGCHTLDEAHGLLLDHSSGVFPTVFKAVGLVTPMPV
jgi:hypothetical protein